MEQRVIFFDLEIGFKPRGRTMKKEILFPNSKVIVHFPKNQDTVRKATEKFLKTIEREKK
jgi:hypothetical protein